MRQSGDIHWTVTRAAPIDPHLRGRVTPRILEGLSARGLHVHRIGQATYVHDDVGDVRMILAVLDRRSTTPAWIHELADHHRWLIGRGQPTGRQERAIAARVRIWATSRIRGHRGEYIGRPAWWQDNDGTPLPGFRRPSRI